MGTCQLLQLEVCKELSTFLHLQNLAGMISARGDTCELLECGLEAGPIALFSMFVSFLHLRCHFAVRSSSVVASVCQIAPVLCDNVDAESLKRHASINMHLPYEFLKKKQITFVWGYHKVKISPWKARE